MTEEVHDPSQGRAPRLAFRDPRFAAAVFFAGLAVFAAVVLGQVPIVHAATRAGDGIVSVVAPGQPTSGPNAVAPPVSPAVAAARSVNTGNGSPDRSGSAGAAITSPVPAIGAPAGSWLKTTSAGPGPATDGGTTTSAISSTTITSTTTTTTAPPPPPPPPTAWQLIALVRTSLMADMAGQAGPPPQLAQAANALAAAEAANLWPASGDGNQILASANPVFDDTKQAIQQLEGVKNPASAWGLPADISTLAAAARLIAVTAITDNSCLAVHQDQMTQAQEQLAQGDAQLAKGPADSAIGTYKGAWLHALSAQGQTCA